MYLHKENRELFRDAILLASQNGRKHSIMGTT